MRRIHRLQIAGVVAAVLLVGFQHVVRQAVRQGEIRRDAVSRLAQASAACSRISRRADREACRARVSRDDTGLGAERQDR